MTAPTPDPGWYPDPEGDPALARYWDGAAWTDRTRRRESGAPAAAPPQPPPARRPLWRRPLLPIAAAVLVAIAVGGFVLLGGSEEAGAEVILQPSASAGTDPFTDSIANSKVAVESGGYEQLAADSAAVESISGSAPGLYGGTGKEAVCDPAALVAFLDENPDKAAAFASVVGVKPKQIADYVSSLTPVLLREDTRVTNHGFIDGQANGFDAVLEAGTAVLVDDRGVPRVRCACGNPLSEPAPTDATPDYTGEAWDGFDDQRLLAVTPAEQQLDSLELVDVNTGESYRQAVGGYGDVRDLIFDFGGVGSLRIGMTAQEAEQATGTQVTFTSVSASHDCAQVSFPELGGLGGLAGNGRTIGSLYSGGDASTTMPRTPAGITIGSTAAEVEAAYPQMRREEGFYNPLTERLIVENDNGDILLFQTDEDGRVAGMQTGREPDVFAPEGCL